jgi:hypothetical protein
MPRPRQALATLSASGLLVTGCAVPNQDTARCDDFQLVLSYVSLVGGLSMDEITNVMLPELITKTKGPLESHLKDVRNSYLMKQTPDLSQIREVCASAGVTLVEPRVFDWSDVDFPE